MIRHISDLNPYSTGGPHDDVARNIENEQMRDAAPSPEQAQEQRRQRLAGEGCLVCGEDDPDELRHVGRHHAACPTRQPARYTMGDLRVFCDEHARSSRELWWAGIVKRARGDPDAQAVVVYGCDHVEYVSMPEFNADAYTDPAVDGWDDLPPTHRPIPSAHIECRCGAQIADVRHVTDRVWAR